MDFLGSPENAEIEKYVTAIELRAASVPLVYRQVDGKGPIYAIHGTSSISYANALEQQVFTQEEAARIITCVDAAYNEGMGANVDDLLRRFESRWPGIVPSHLKLKATTP